MSISQLFRDNSYILYCAELNGNVISIDATVSNLTVIADSAFPGDEGLIATMSGAIVGNLEFDIYIIGKVVHMLLASDGNAFTASPPAAMAATSNVIIPVRYRPTTQQFVPINIQNNGNQTAGVFQINTNGSFAFGPSDSGSLNFTNMGQGGLSRPTSVSWVLF